MRRPGLTLWFDLDYFVPGEDTPYRLPLPVEVENSGFMGSRRSPLPPAGQVRQNAPQFRFQTIKFSERSFNGYRLYCSQLPLSTQNVVVWKVFAKSNICIRLTIKCLYFGSIFN
jgi:hypothetical protein